MDDRVAEHNTQAVIHGKDFSMLEEKNLIEIDCKKSLLHSSYLLQSVDKNLGIYKKNEKYYTSRFCGITWLRTEDGEKCMHDKKPVILKISPRFNTLNVNSMLLKIAEDDEFTEYLSWNKSPGERLVTFFFDEEMIEDMKVDDNHNQLIAAYTFLLSLQDITRRPLMSKNIKRTGNFTGKVRGTISIKQNIRNNVLRGHQERIYCRYYEKTEDIPENQILKYALLIVEEYFNHIFSNNKADKAASLIRTCKYRMRHISTVKFQPKDIDHVILPNMYTKYRVVYQMAKVILSEMSVIPENGESQGACIVPYAINMPLLFECYVRALVKEVIKEKEGKSVPKLLKYVSDKSEIMDTMEYGCIEVTKGDKVYISGKIVPDIVLEYTEKEGEKYYRIFDVKYKDFAESQRKNQNRDDRIQLLAYNCIYQSRGKTGHIFPKIDHQDKNDNINENNEKLEEIIIDEDTESKNESPYYVKCFIG